MFTATVRTQYPNRIELNLGSLTGPLSSPTLGAFDPRRDIEVYVDGLPQTVISSYFDVATNSYRLFTASPFSADGVVQVIHHMPNPPFVSS